MKKYFSYWAAYSRRDGRSPRHPAAENRSLRGASAAETVARRKPVWPDVVERRHAVAAPILRTSVAAAALDDIQEADVSQGPERPLNAATIENRDHGPAWRRS
jgi:hypothetical protein